MHLHSLKLLRQKVKEEMHLQDLQYLTFDLGVKSTRNVAQYPLHYATYSATKFEVATSNSFGAKIHLQEKTLFDP